MKKMLALSALLALCLAPLLQAADGNWQTDPEKASALAQKDQKPIFVYFFLKRNVGPAAAPC